jgi:ATP/maltotriose-dependent transcriptional regulator MalT
MNTSLQYDVTDIQISHNHDGTLHVALTIPDRPAQRSSQARKSSLTSSGTQRLIQGKQPLKIANFRGDDALVEPLSKREREVLTILVRGASNQEIACALTITHNTVKRHVKTILAKLGVSNRTQAVVCALQFGLLEQKPTKAPPRQRSR